MCQIMILTGLDPQKHKQTEAFIKASVKPLTTGNSDGFGYAAITHNGLVGERWLDPIFAFSQRQVLTSATQKTVDVLGDMVEVTETYTRHGKINTKATFKGATSVLVHARFATCEISLENVHPFIYNDTALIHNGVIWNTSDHDNKISTCDSESILHSYLDARMPTKPSSIDRVAESLDGYYACGVFTKDKQRRWVLDVFKSPSANLIACRIPSLGDNAIVFATNIGIIYHCAKEIKTAVSGQCTVASGVLTRFNAVTGATMNQFLFDTIGDYQITANSWDDANYDYPYSNNNFDKAMSSSKPGKPSMLSLVNGRLVESTLDHPRSGVHRHKSLIDKLEKETATKT